jgi:hypothetical protein
MFKMICHFYNVFPRFLDIISGFGKRMASVDEHFMGCYGRISAGMENKQAWAPWTFGSRNLEFIRRNPLIPVKEICYSIRHYELHGRELEDPWSCRHTAIYQKYFVESNSNYSTWIIIQSPSAFRENRGALAGELDNQHSTWKKHPMALHLGYLAACGIQWRKYLNHMSEQLTVLVCLPSLNTAARHNRNLSRTGKYRSLNNTENMRSTSRSASTYNTCGGSSTMRSAFSRQPLIL